MIKILTIIGARPQIIKAAALSRAIKNNFQDQIKEIIVHTGQHYDENMSKVFFDELGIPQPDYNLNVGSGSHGKQTATMITGIEEILLKEKPDCIVLYGDTNSTLAGGVAASKIHCPIVHIEAGLRSFSKVMPEEVNRIMCDHVSTLLFSPTQTGIKNLIKEGFNPNATPPYTMDNPKVFHCGDVMLDNSMYFSEIADNTTPILKENGLEKEKYLLATVHRNNNTDEPKRLSSLFAAFDEITREESIDLVLPIHPRTAKLLETNLFSETLHAVKNNPRIKILPPASFLEMIALEKNALMILTDSGGVQKEAFFFKKPCIILRPETEWVELVESGNAIVTDADKTKIKEAFTHFKNKKDIIYPPFYGNAHAAEFICLEMINCFGKS